MLLCLIRARRGFRTYSMSGSSVVCDLLDRGLSDQKEIAMIVVSSGDESSPVARQSCIGSKSDGRVSQSPAFIEAEVVRLSTATQDLPAPIQTDVAGRLCKVARYLTHNAHGAACYELQLIKANIASARLKRKAS